MPDGIKSSVNSLQGTTEPSDASAGAKISSSLLHSEAVSASAKSVENDSKAPSSGAPAHAIPLHSSNSNLQDGTSSNGDSSKGKTCIDLTGDDDDMNSLRPYSQRRSAKRKTKDDDVIFIDEERTCHTRSQSRKIEQGNEQLRQLTEDRAFAERIEREEKEAFARGSAASSDAHGNGKQPISASNALVGPAQMANSASSAVTLPVSLAGKHTNVKQNHQPQAASSFNAFIKQEIGRLRKSDSSMTGQAAYQQAVIAWNAAKQGNSEKKKKKKKKQSKREKERRQRKQSKTYGEKGRLEREKLKKEQAERLKAEKEKREKEAKERDERAKRLVRDAVKSFPGPDGNTSAPPLASARVPGPAAPSPQLPAGFWKGAATIPSALSFSGPAAPKAVADGFIPSSLKWYWERKRQYNSPSEVFDVPNTASHAQGLVMSFGTSMLTFFGSKLLDACTSDHHRARRSHRRIPARAAELCGRP
jgi:hypothetical protein